MRATLLITLVAALAGAPACFKPELANVAFRCGDGGLCPGGYFCAADGCCHKDGTDPSEPGYCRVTADAALPDANVQQDAAVTPDAAPPDAATPDAATPDATVPDATIPDAAPVQDASPTVDASP